MIQISSTTRPGEGEDLRGAANVRLQAPGRCPAFGIGCHQETQLVSQTGSETADGLENRSGGRATEIDTTDALARHPAAADVIDGTAGQRPAENGGTIGSSHADVLPGTSIRISAHLEAAVKKILSGSSARDATEQEDEERSRGSLSDFHGLASD